MRAFGTMSTSTRKAGSAGSFYSAKEAKRAKSAKKNMRMESADDAYTDHLLTYQGAFR